MAAISQVQNKSPPPPQPKLVPPTIATPPPPPTRCKTPEYADSLPVNSQQYCSNNRFVQS